MTVAYKYCSPDIRERIADGNILLRTLSYYRETENKKIQDPNDGKVTHHVTGTYNAGESLLLDGGGQQFRIINNQGKGKAIANHILVVQQFDALAFCASLERTDEYWNNTASGSHDAVVYISNFENLAERILKVLRNQWPLLSHKAGIVSYTKAAPTTETKGSIQTLSGTSPFQKDPAFKKECEIRALFFPNDQDTKLTPELKVPISIEPLGLLL